MNHDDGAPGDLGIVFDRHFFSAGRRRGCLRFQAADEHLSTFFTERPAGLVVPVGAYLLSWLARSIESLLEPLRDTLGKAPR